MVHNLINKPYYECKTCNKVNLCIDCFEKRQNCVEKIPLKPFPQYSIIKSDK